MSSRRRQKDLRKQERALLDQRVEGIKGQIERGPLAGVESRVNSSGKEKMSDVLDAFVAPYAGMAPTDDDLRKLFAVAIIAWNAAILGPDGQKEVLDAHTGRILPDATDHERYLLRGFIERLIERKDTLFADNRRSIVSFELTTGADRAYLSVVSTFGDVPGSNGA